MCILWYINSCIISAFTLFLKKFTLFNSLIGAGILCALLPSLTIWAISEFVPANKRTSGERKLKYIWKKIEENFFLGVGIVFLILLLIFLGIWVFSSFGSAFKFLMDAIRIFGITSIFGYIFTHYESIFSKRNIEETTKTDVRNPVLFIRSFNMDIDPFFWGTIHKNDDIVDTNFSGFKNSKRVPNFNFQNFFARCFDENIGKLIGLGNPARSLPLESLVSSYYEDDDWKIEYKNWAEKARCIVTIPANTNGLNFELNHILQHGLTSKFFIFMPTHNVKNYFQKFMLPILKWSFATEKNDWSMFYKNMKALGYNLQKEEPKKGTVIGFDISGNQKILTENAVFPIEFVNAVKKHISANKSFEN